MAESDADVAKSAPNMRVVSFNLYNAQTEALNDAAVFVSDIVSNPDATVSSLELAYVELKAEYQAFSDAFHKYEVYILEDTSSHTSVSREFRSLKREAIKLLNQVSQLKDAKSNIPPSPPSPVNSLPTPKLAPIEIPKFDGDVFKWSAFWDIFSSLVDSRSDLDDVIKFTTLRSHLLGRAFRTIEGIPVTHANYKAAVNLLKNQFGKSDRLVTQLAREIQNLPVPRHQHDDLLEFKLSYEKLVLQLENLEPHYTENNFFMQTLISKLPGETFRALSNRYKCTKFSYDQLADGLSEIIELMELCKLQPQGGGRKTDVVSKVTVESPAQSNYKPKSLQKVKRSQFSKPQSTDHSVKSVVVSSQPNITHSFSCVFCSKNHNSKHCTEYPTLDSRRCRVRVLNLCFICLKSGHRASDCTKKLECRNCCSDSHHTFLCLKLCQNPQNPSRTIPSSSPNLNVSSQFNNNAMSVSGNPTPIVNQVSSHSGAIPKSSSNNQACLTNAAVHTLNTSTSRSLLATALPTATLQLSGGGLRRVTRGFLDIGSQRTFIQSDLAKELNLPVVDHVNLSVTPFDSKVKHLYCDVVKVQVRLGRTRVTLRALTHDSVNTSIHTPGLVKVANMLRTHNVKLADDYKNDVVTGIGLIIGADNFGKFVSSQSKCANIQLLSCSAGSIIFGTLPNWASSLDNCSEQSQPVCRAVCSRICTHDVEPPTEQISNLWKLDNVGIIQESYSPEEKLTLEKFDASIRYDSETQQYSVDLPFISDTMCPPLNFRKAYGQLMSLKRAIEHNPDLYQQYNAIFSDYLAQDFIEPASEQLQGHYLPYHGVRKESVTTPLRIVFNASSCQSVDGLSLNSCLLTGPSLTTKLLDYLIGFRTNPFACISDISKAFLRIGINEGHRDFTKFLWFRDSTLQEVDTYRFRVVLFGATCSPFLLQRTLVHHLQNHTNPLAEHLIQHFYVDNFSRTYHSEEQMFYEYPVINRILLDANMPLQTWISNVPQFNSAIQVDASEPNVNVLGLKWNTVKDVLSIKQSNQINQYVEQDSVLDINQPKSPKFKLLSKRKVVSLVASLFDPLGFVTPLLIGAKIFIQKLWNMKISWDTPLERELCVEFHEICKNLCLASSLEFPRFAILPSKCELHIFADASKRAYGFAAYSVQIDSQSSCFIMSKSRVTPLKELTIPKLELTALNLASKFASSLMGNKCLDFTSCTLWSDSLVSISWIQNNKSTDVYVRNRVNEIKEKNYRICYVPTKDNPADLLTRGITFSNLSNSSLWMFGPSWITNPLEYPCQLSSDNDNVVVSELLVEPTAVEPNVPCIDVSRYSSLSKVVRILVIVIRFVQSFSRKFIISLSPLHLLVKFAQQECYPSLLHYLSHGDSHNVASDIINFVNQLGLYLDPHNLIRTCGRLQNAAMPDSMKNPILLPPKSAVSTLLIRRCHEKNHHAGVNTVIMQLRENFWLPQARRHIKTTIHSCMHCRKLLRAPLTLPPVPPLPPERVTYRRPFQCVGVDMTGAYEVHDKDPDEQITVRGKAYICLFTCSATRAVHLELLHTLTTSEFLLAFRRFCAQHSVPEMIISDHGTNFRGCENFLRRINDEPEVLEHMKGIHLRWKFITPRSPWEGGFYERLIGVVKNSLNKSICKKKLSFVELQTVICEICTIVNSRPLTFVSDSPDSEYLTPNHLLYGRNIVIAPPLNEFMGGDIPYLENDELRVQYSTLSAALAKFTKVWVSLYLTSLRERHYGNKQGFVNCPLKIGDIVLVDLDSAHRNLWPMGKVIKLFHGHDGQVRSCQVQVKNALYERSITKIVPLEVTAEERNSVIDSEIESEPPLRQRPLRKAALNANEKRQAWLQDDLL